MIRTIQSLTRKWKWIEYVAIRNQWISCFTCLLNTTFMFALRLMYLYRIPNLVNSDAPTDNGNIEDLGPVLFMRGKLEFYGEARARIFSLEKRTRTQATVNFSTIFSVRVRKHAGDKNTSPTTKVHEFRIEFNGLIFCSQMLFWKADTLVQLQWIFQT